MDERERYVSCIATQEEADSLILLIRRRKTEIGREKEQSLTAQIRRVILDYVRNPGDDRRLIEYIQDHIDKNGVYLSNLFKEKEGTTLQEFAIEQRAEHAKDLMSDGDLNITEISERCGYSSAAHMSNQFKKTAGITPSEWRRLELARTAELPSRENESFKLNH